MKKNCLSKTVEHQPYQPRVCLGCGVPVGDGVAFCEKCRASLDARTRQNIANKVVRDRRRAQRLCIFCGMEDELTLAGRTTCFECRQKASRTEYKNRNNGKERETMKYRLTELPRSKLDELLDSTGELYEPFGKFYCFDEAEGVFVAVDNRDGHAYTEEFATKDDVLRWYRGTTVADRFGYMVRNPYTTAMAEKVKGVFGG